MTQERLAELADLNIRTLQKIEAGQINILVTTLLRLQRALGCPWKDLLPPEQPPLALELENRSAHGKRHRTQPK